MAQVVWIVKEFAEGVDSVWSDKTQAETRIKELDKENDGEFATAEKFLLNTRKGFI